MKHRYSHILKPLQIKDKVLKNRLLSTKCVSQMLQGPENYPTEATMTFYESLARNGASIVCVAMGTYPDKEGKHPPMSNIDMTNFDVLGYFHEITDRIHAQGSLASASMQNVEPHDVGICYDENWDEIPKTGDYSRNFENKPTISKERIQEMTEDFARQAKTFKKLGFDMCTIYMSYRGGILANSLSPLINQRTDEYGGSPENRWRMSLDVFRAIRQACGENFLIECQVSPTEEEPGYTFEDFLAYAKEAQKYVDIFQLRAWEGALNHGNGFNQTEHHPYMLDFAEQMKKEGINAVISPVGTFQNPDDIERFLAEGKCDTVSMARAFICDSHYYEKIQEERGEDIVPCLLCNACHGAECRVNPRYGREHALAHIYPVAPVKHRKVAVIGGGPAGAVAALTAASRGHEVTLFEKEEKLGGQLNHVDYSMPFKWPLRNYRDYLTAQLEKSPVEIRMGTKASPEMIEQEGYDAVIAALGAVGTLPNVVKGAENAYLPMDALKRDDLGSNIVVVGGGEVGFETALSFGTRGAKVTVVSRRKHYPVDWHTLKATRDYMETLKDFTYLTKCQTTEIGKNYVVYNDENGQTHRLDCDSVIFSGGRASRMQEGAAFAEAAPVFYLIGDGKTPASVREAVRDGYTAAMNL